MNWKTIKSSYAFICPWLRVRKDHVQLPSGFEIDDFYVVESSDWVNVIAITEDGRFLIEEQYRYGIGQVCFELPAGVVSKGEVPLTAAKRELKEETGYSGGQWCYFCTSAPNASGMSSLCHTFLARGVRKTTKPNPERSEDIQVYIKSYDEVRSILINNNIIEAVMQAALWKFFSEN